MKSTYATTATLKMAVISLWFVSTHTLAATLPKPATAVITQIHNAAKLADYAMLQSVMTQDFSWSFGGDASATQAIAGCKANPSTLNQLMKATRQPCRLHADNTVECPNNAGIGYRAGFKNTSAGWRIFYFVEGD